MSVELTQEERTHLEATRAIIDRILGSNHVEPEESVPPAEPKYMKLTQYAESRSLSKRTLDRYIAKGFPVKRTGTKLRRVLVVEADAWLEKHSA